MLLIINMFMLTAFKSGSENKNMYFIADYYKYFALPVFIILLFHTKYSFALKNVLTAMNVLMLLHTLFSLKQCGIFIMYFSNCICPIHHTIGGIVFMQERKLLSF